MNVLKLVDAFLFGHVDYAMASRYSVDESVRRVATLLQPWSWNPLGIYRAGLYGKVEPHQVAIHRLVPLFHNSFQPYFVGRFVADPSGVRLEGVFTAHWYVKVFMTFWLAFAAFVFVAALPGVASLMHMSINGSTFVFFTLLPVGLALTIGGRWLSRKDVSVIANALDAALS